MASIQTGFKWITDARHVNEQYFLKEFTDPSCKVDWQFKYVDPLTSKEVILQKPNHGGPHTFRSAGYVPIVLGLYNRCNNTSLSSRDVEDIQLTLLFYVVGRTNDSHNLNFRKRSAQIFKEHVMQHHPSWFTEETFRFYRRALKDKCDPKDPRYLVTRICHCIDLARCEREVYEKKLKDFSQWIGDIKKIDRMVKECLRQTGDRIIGEQDYQGPLFNRCSTNVYFCFRQINRAIRATIPTLQLPIAQSSQPSIQNLLDLLCDLIEIEAIKHHPTLPKILDAKVGDLLAYPESYPLDQINLKFYRLLQRLRLDGQLSSTVIELLQQSTRVSENLAETSSGEKTAPQHTSALLSPSSLKPEKESKHPIHVLPSQASNVPPISSLYLQMTDKAISLEKLKVIPIAEFIAVLEKEPQNATLYCNLGRVLPIGGSIVLNHLVMTQQQLFLRAIDLDQNLAKAYYNLAITLPLNGNIRLLNGTSVTQQKLLLRAIDLDPRLSLAYTILGVSLPVNGNIQLLNGTSVTQQQLQLKALDLNPDSPMVNYNLAITFEGSIQLLNGINVTQQQLFLRAIQSDPNFSWAYAGLGRTLLAGESIRLPNGILMTKEQILLKSCDLGPTGSLPYALLD